MAFRVLFAITTYYNLDIDQMDIKIAFLYSLIDQFVYVQIPKRSEDATSKRIVCKLLKALYNLKQVLSIWYKKLSKFLFKRLGLQWINVNHSIFVTFAGINGPIVSTFIDDINIIGTKKSGHIERVNVKPAVVFEMVDISLINFFLGLKIERDRQKQSLKLSQPVYIEKILEKYYLYLAKLCNILIKEKILPPNKRSEASQAEEKQYQRMT